MRGTKYGSDSPMILRPPRSRDLSRPPRASSTPLIDDISKQMAISTYIFLPQNGLHAVLLRVCEEVLGLWGVLGRAGDQTGRVAGPTGRLRLTRSAGVCRSRACLWRTGRGQRGAGGERMAGGRGRRELTHSVGRRSARRTDGRWLDAGVGHKLENRRSCQP